MLRGVVRSRGRVWVVVAAVLGVVGSVLGSVAVVSAQQQEFSDVSGTHAPAVEALAADGVFAGTECDEGLFCIDEPIKRWEAAVWMVRVLDGIDPQVVRFGDVDGGVWWAAFVERLAVLGVTTGCEQGDPPLFCPNDVVTRAQMASFLVRAFDLEAAESYGFVDVSGNTHEADIDALAKAGVTTGCAQDPLSYCPDNKVKRGEMATFLHRAQTMTKADPDDETDTDDESDPSHESEEPGADDGTGSVGGGTGDSLIAASRGRTCAVRADGTVICWGGDRGFLEKLSASRLENVVALSTADDQVFGLHTCVVHRDGSISCWGPGSEGQLGQGDTSSHYLPVLVPGIEAAVAVAAGESFTCVVHDDGGVSCWGANWLGQLGDGSVVLERGWPKRVPGLVDAAAIAAGQSHSCAIHRDGSLSCWGNPYSATPSKVQGLEAVSSVSMGGYQTCVATVSGSIYCWQYGETNVSEVSRVGAIDDAVEVSVGDGTVCVLHRDGAVSCWGRNEVGQVGDGTTTDRSDPVRLAGITDAVSVSVSLGSPGVGAHVCALHKDTSVSCWGGNELGQLGDSTLDNGLTPRRVEYLDAIPPHQIPTTARELALYWVDTVVQNREADFPWLRVAWDHVRDVTSVGQSGFGAFVTNSCYVNPGQDPPFGCHVWSMTFTAIELGGAVHELLHVYDLHTGLAPSKAWGAVQLYFATTYPGCYAPGGNKDGAEILADTVTHIMVPHAWLTYYESPGCPELPHRPSAEAEQVVLQGLAGQVPDWYTENITNGTELWAAWLRSPSMPVLANLAGEFGGLCSTDWITHPLDPERFPAAGTNPFKDGGC